MKKILIINQHTSNHGDEAAGIALIRELKSNYKNAKISVLYNWYEKLEDDAFIGLNEFKDVKHFSFGTSKFDAALVRVSLFFPLLINILSLFSRNLKSQLSIIRDSDIVINGPGGVNIGPYKDYYYLWRLVAVKYHKKVLAIYSISFGPFDGLPNFFIKRSLDILKYAQFLSLRDDKSHRFADSFNLDYKKSIDTAFLSKKNETIPTIYSELEDTNYVVVVPNELYSWHPYFKKINKSSLDNFYISIIENFIEKYNYKVVLLPQLFSSQDDTEYFKRLKNTIDNDNILVIDTKFNSDIQQKIIRGSEFIVGARYHTIIFAINNQIPFFALSYEHKMENMLSLLGLSEYKLDLISTFQKEELDTNSVLDKISSFFDNKEDIKQKVELASHKAHKISNKTFVELKRSII